MTTKITPTLTGFVEDEFSRCIAPETCSIPCGKLRRELRALLAVARAAKAVPVPGYVELGRMKEPWQRMQRALARLDRVSASSK